MIGLLNGNENGSTTSETVLEVRSLNAVSNNPR